MTAIEEKPTRTAGDERAELIAAVNEAKQRVSECEKECKDASRRVALAEEPAEEYHREVGEGRKPSPLLEKKLQAQLTEACTGLRMRAETRPYGGGLHDTLLTWVDPAAENRLTGARNALAKAGSALEDFTRQNFGRLIGELVPEAVEIAHAGTAALEASREASAKHERFRSQIATLCVQAGREALLGQMPFSAFSVPLSEAPRRAPLCLPDSFLPGPRETPAAAPEPRSSRPWGETAA